MTEHGNRRKEESISVEIPKYQIKEDLHLPMPYKNGKGIQTSTQDDSSDPDPAELSCLRVQLLVKRQTFPLQQDPI